MEPTRRPRNNSNKLYTAWLNMRARCLNANRPDYVNYGGRGIAVCDRWNRSFDAFVEDMGEPGPGQSLDRIDTDGDYEPGNCRWADRVTQARNTRANRRLTADGATRTVAEWAEVTGFPEGTIRSRIRIGWSVEEAIYPERRESSPKERKKGAGVRRGRWAYADANNSAKLTAEQVLWVRANPGVSAQEAAAMLHVGPSAIWDIRRRRTWKHVA